jgi:hypothetical protein
MIDSRFNDPEQIQRLHQQKMDAMKVIMSEIIDNPASVNKQDLMKVIDYLDQNSNNNDDNDND